MELLRHTRTALLLIFALLTIHLSGCASSPEIHALYQENTDFTQYQTFSFASSLEPTGEQYSSITSQYLKAAIRTELSARGITETDDGALLVNFHVSTKEKISSTTTPTSYYGYRGGYGYTYGVGYGTETRISQYTEGTLNIDIVDKQKQQLIWEGVAVGRLKDKPSKNYQADINKVVKAIFGKYPTATINSRP